MKNRFPSQEFVQYELSIQNSRIDPAKPTNNPTLMMLIYSPLMDPSCWGLPTNWVAIGITLTVLREYSIHLI